MSLHCPPYVHSHNRIHGFWLDKHSNGVQLCHLQSLNGISGHVQDTVLALLRHLAHTRHRSAIQIVIVLASLDEQVVLDVPLHLLPRRHKVVVPTVHLVVSL